MPIVMSESVPKGRGLTILFELEDLARTRFASAPLPMYELVFTVHSGNWDRLLLPHIRPLAELVRQVADLQSRLGGVGGGARAVHRRPERRGA